MIKTLAVMVAMTSEMKRIAALLTDAAETEVGPFTVLTGTLAGTRVVLMHSGIGKVNAAAACVEIIKTFAPDAIVSTGVAGGLTSDTRVMDVVVARSCIYHDMWCGEGHKRGEVQDLCTDGFVCDAALLRAAMALPTDVRLHLGQVITGDRFITDRTELEELRQAFPQALAVDMESAATAHVAHLYGVPFISFRIISDTPGADAHQQQYDNFWQIMADGSFAVTRLFLEQVTRQ